VCRHNNEANSGLIVLAHPLGIVWRDALILSFSETCSHSEDYRKSIGKNPRFYGDFVGIEATWYAPPLPLLGHPCTFKRTSKRHRETHGGPHCISRRRSNSCCSCWALSVWPSW